jgi:Large polyvalent protein associated domain 30/Large polyvalent protein associated domain 29
MFTRPDYLDSKTTIVVVGQRVHSILYGGRDGIIFRINGEQAPASVGSIGGVMSFGGRATFDIVFEDHVSPMLPESILRGVQWRIYDEVATPEEIKTALAVAEAAKVAKAAAETAAGERRAAEREAHKAENPHLFKFADKPGWSGGRLAAANIRIELKKTFPATKFKVTSSHNSVSVSWTDGPSYDVVRKLVGKYQAGHFNGMEDIYENNREATFAQVFGDPEYTSCSREATLDAVRQAWVAKEDWHKASDVPDDFLQANHMTGVNFWIRNAWLETSF